LFEGFVDMIGVQYKMYLPQNKSFITSTYTPGFSSNIVLIFNQEFKIMIKGWEYSVKGRTKWGRGHKVLA